MARTKQTARRSTGGRPRVTSATSLTNQEKKEQELIKKGPMQVQIKYLERRYDNKGNQFVAEQRDIKQEKEKVDWWQKFVICVTRQLDYSNKHVQSTSVQINSQPLKDLLKLVIGNYPGQSFHTKNISINFPPHCLYHYRHEIEKAGEAFPVDSEATEHTALLTMFINEHFEETISESENLIEQGLILYEHLWTIFRPGVTLYARSLGQDRAFKLLSYHYVCGMRNYLQMEVSFVDYDGEHFGTRDTSMKIPAYSGAERVVDLNVYPIDFHESPDHIKAALIKRGHVFESLQGQNFREYAGIALQLGCSTIRYNISGRVMIDCKTFHRLDANSAFEVTAFSTTEQNLAPAPAGRKPLKRKAQDYDSELLPGGEVKPQPLTEDHLLLANATVRGFSFAEKSFLDFFVDNLKEVNWNLACFDQLVLAQSQKDLVQALVATHSLSGPNGFDDIVKGKGKGLILVLHGPPGTGKTLTAECVAEFSRRPLYIVSSGDLGTSSEALDARLSRILDMASTWKAVLLIDEADVFLEERTNADIERNSLVSIFLRVLEYYQGILFLTTNRVSTFDDAFKSRIHVPLKYNNLPFTSRRQIWKTLLAKVDDGYDVDEHGLDVLAKHELNGRQVKNIVRTAHSLAKFKKRGLDLAQLEQVVDIQMQFERDLSLPQNLPTP